MPHVRKDRLVREWVDFHWEVDGKTYDFSIPGGGFVSLSALVEVLGIARSDNNGVDGSNDAVGNTAAKVGGADDDTAQVAGETPAGVAEEAALTLDGIEISESTRKFVEDVERVEFSSPELVWVGKATEATTVGALKNVHGLECEYSADLTEAQIGQINGTSVDAGDWALVSLKAFDTEESLTVTMKDGEQFVIRVMDAHAGDPLGLNGQTYLIADSSNSKVLKNKADSSGNGRLQAVTLANDGNLQWTFEFEETAFNGAGGYFVKNTVTDITVYLCIKSGQLTVVSDKEQATPFSVEYNDEKGYRLSADKDRNTNFLAFTNNSYFSASTNKNDGGTWLKLRDTNISSNKPGKVGTWDIRGDEITLKLFDYSGVVQRSTGSWKDGSYVQNGGHDGTYQIDKVWGYETNSADLRAGDGINKNRTLLFSGSGLNGNNVERLNEFTGEYRKQKKTEGTMYSALPDQGIVSRILYNKIDTSKPDDKYPALSTDWTWQSADLADNGSLGYLFGSKGTIGQVSYDDEGNKNGHYDSKGIFHSPEAHNIVNIYDGSDHKGLNGLLRKDEDGYYYYDSESNYAELQGDEIVLYSDNYQRNVTGDSVTLLRKNKIGFFPFDEYNAANKEEKTTSGGIYNHQFGMSMETKFVYPENGRVPGTEDLVTGVADPMIFEFSGDDDVWVYIDGVLVLDLGGVHQPVHGTINFATGDVTIEAEYGDGTKETKYNTTIDAMFAAATQEARARGILKDSDPDYTFDRTPYSTHDFNFFYLERGGCDSNCSINFNLMISKTLTVAKKLNGLTPTERAKYLNDEFLYELAFKHNSQNIHMEYDDENQYWVDEDGNPTTDPAWRTDFSTYNTTDPDKTNPANHTVKTLKDGTEEKGVAIKDGHIKLKDGESMTITHLPRTDIFYLAEESQLDMNQFEVPHAERLYVDTSDQQKHEEEVHLHQDHALSDSKDDWETRPYALMDTERLVYTNTLQEKNLQVKKEWKDNLSEHEPIQFKLLATVDGEPYNSPTTGAKTINAQWTETRDGKTITRTEDVVAENKTFTLSKENNWTIDIEHLPKYTESKVGESATDSGKEIIYSVEEVVPKGYSVTYEGPDDTNLAYLDLYKFWPDDNSNHDGTTEEKKAEHISTYIKRSDGKYITAARGANGEYYYTGVTEPDANGNLPESAKFELVSKTKLPTDMNSAAGDLNKQHEMFDYAVRISNVPLSEKVGNTTVTYSYNWDEKKDEDAATKGLVLFTRPEKELRILNSKGSINVEKEWLDEDGTDLENHPDEIKYSVYQLKHEHEWAEYDPEKKEWTTEKADGEGWYKISDAKWDDDGNPINGEEQRQCRFASCKHYTETRTIVPTPCSEHEWSETRTEATCSAAGLITRKCSVCHQMETETIPQLTHNYVAKVTKEATCKEEGVRTYACSLCGDSYTEAIDKLPHNWSEWETVKAATTTTEGQKKRICSACGEIETEMIPVLQNVYPGTDIALDESVTWPTGAGTVKPSGIFKYNNEYWVIVQEKDFNKSQASGGPGGDAHSWGVTVKLNVNGKIYTKDIFGNGQRTDMAEGDLYKAVDGTYYVYTNKYTPNSKDPTNDPNNWYQIPNTGANSATNNSGTVSKAAHPQYAMKAMTRATDSNEKEGGNDPGDGNAGDSRALSSTVRKNVTAKNLTLDQLLADLNLKGLDIKNPDTGDTLTLYNSYDKVSLETKSENSETLVDGKTNLWRSASIPILLDENNIEYRYYVVEDTPAVGGDYQIAYTGQSQGLRDGDIARITNQKVTEVEVIVIKVDVGNTETKLGGAVFSLYDKDDVADGKVKKGANPITANLTTSDVAATLGKVSLGKLKSGTYYLVETKAPGGYNLADSPIQIVVNKSSVSVTQGGSQRNATITQEGINRKAEVTVTNSAGYALPSTGGPGTLLFTLIGMILVLLSGGLVVMKYKNRKAGAR